jgi:hypothetical protein
MGSMMAFPAPTQGPPQGYPYQQQIPSQQVHNTPSQQVHNTPSQQSVQSAPQPVQQQPFNLTDTNLANYQQRLVHLNHAMHCEESNANPQRNCRLTPKCAEYVTLLRHLQTCTGVNCNFAECTVTYCILEHHRKCDVPTCKLCEPANATKKRKQLRQDTIRMPQRVGSSSSIGSNGSLTNSNTEGNRQKSGLSTGGQYSGKFDWCIGLLLLNW